MAIDYNHLMTLESTGNVVRYGDREAMLYALSIGMGRDPLNTTELDFVFEKNPLKTIPTMASVVARVPLLMNCGFDYTKVLHAEQHLRLHQPLPAESELIADARVIEAFDKGKAKGALIYTETTARSKSDGSPLFTATSSIFARGDGGFGGSTASSPQPHVIPDRRPDTTCSIKTRDDQALLYRLNGDRNPLHADPELANNVGFPVPILHGLCTYGTACLAVLKTICNYDHTLITGFDVRFSAPVYPGETIITDIWRDNHIVSFECRVAERNVTVIRNGKCTLAN